MWPIESEIRARASLFHNSYQIGIFACCRELFSIKNHCHFFAGTQEEVQAHFDKLIAGMEADAKDQSELNEITELKRQLAEANNKMQQYQQVEAQRDAMKGKPNTV